MVECDKASELMAEITDPELDLFLSLARAAGAHDGYPPVDPSAVGLVSLKRAGLLATVADAGELIVHFTGAGRCLAHSHGVDIPL